MCKPKNSGEGLSVVLRLALAVAAAVVTYRVVLFIEPGIWAAFWGLLAAGIGLLGVAVANFIRYPLVNRWAYPKARRRALPAAARTALPQPDRQAIPARKVIPGVVLPAGDREKVQG